jgi:N-acetylglucosaminyldiphosphoundecaprenol N-acetyl-beta-D-mannosaminyltransferase
MMENSIETIRFCDIELVCATRDEFAKFAISQSRKFRSLISYSLNGESLAKYHYDKNFAPMLLQADYIHADGMSIVSASRKICPKGLPERIATTDWFHDVASLTEETGEGHYFLGATEETLIKTLFNVRKMYPKLNIVGSHNGYFSEDGLEAILEDIKLKRPHIIWVGLGRPKQELVSSRIKEACEVGLIKTCGGLFDFLSGNNKRSPIILQKIGLEWLYRLSLEPRRLFKRYLVTNTQCLLIFFKYRKERSV